MASEVDITCNANEATDPDRKTLLDRSIGWRRRVNRPLHESNRRRSPVGSTPSRRPKATSTPQLLEGSSSDNKNWAENINQSKCHPTGIEVKTSGTRRQLSEIMKNKLEPSKIVKYDFKKHRKLIEAELLAALEESENEINPFENSNDDPDYLSESEIMKNKPEPSKIVKYDFKKHRKLIEAELLAALEESENEINPFENSSDDPDYLSESASGRESESVIQKFRKTFSLHFHHQRKSKSAGEKEDDPVVSPPPSVADLPMCDAPEEESMPPHVPPPSATCPIDAPPSAASPTPPRIPTLEDDVADGSSGEQQGPAASNTEHKYKFGGLVWRNSKEKKKLTKAARNAKCNSGDSGIQIEVIIFI
ncbi:unnamed protein product [Diabrotica balteata]|uniref:Uncharacterized protein n=1 Tax=Diabrotica balteata TaxID=107213 RepID=A0A9N9SU46_DIABA|nr:unnamed protein product [Diabrotica balteata]